MPHLHEQIDFIVNAWIVYKGKVLLVHHKQLDTWLPIGGHIELDEDPDQAVEREIAEESGLKRDELEFLGSTAPSFEDDGTRGLMRPHFVDIHPITKTHSHVGLNYVFAASHDSVSLADQEHHDIAWFDRVALDKAKLRQNVAFFAQAALQLAGER